MINKLAEERPIPNDLESEQAVLGTILTDNTCINSVMSILKAPVYFYHPKHQHIFRCMIELSKENEKIDSISIAEKLKSCNLLDEIGGYAYLGELPESAFDSLYSEKWCKIISEKYHLRESITIGYDLSRMCRDPEAKSKELVDDAINKLMDLREKLGVNSKLVSAWDRLPVIMKRIEDVAAGKIETGLFTGFYEIDEQHGGGLQKTDLIFIAAEPSTGKTSLAVCFGVGLAGRGKKGLFFSIESSMDSIIQDRMIPSVLEIDSYKLRESKRLSDKEWEKLYGIFNYENVFKNIKICDLSNINLNDMYSMINLEHKNNGVDFVMIDYVQLMNSLEKTGNKNDDLGEVAKAMKRINKDFNVPIIALSQVNEKGKLRSSGELENAADVKILLSKTADYENTGLIEAEYKKNRNGRIGPVLLHFTPEFTKFKTVN